MSQAQLNSDDSARWASPAQTGVLGVMPQDTAH